MALNADFGKRVLVHSEQLEWSPSPIPGVDRRMLDRIGGEVARATTVVRYAPGSEFSRHVHTGGEEFVVLDGVFQDEHGTYPAGTYVRNPPSTAHTPRSEQGCTIFVKLWQFAMDDRYQVSMPMVKALQAGENGVATALLHQDGREVVTYHELRANAGHTNHDGGGIEMLVLAGSLRESGLKLGRGGWLRLPDGERLIIQAGPDGAHVWIKTGHLTHAKPPGG